MPNKRREIIDRDQLSGWPVGKNVPTLFRDGVCQHISTATVEGYHTTTSIYLASNQAQPLLIWWRRDLGLGASKNRRICNHYVFKVVSQNLADRQRVTRVVTRVSGGTAERRTGSVTPARVRNVARLVHGRGDALLRVEVVTRVDVLRLERFVNPQKMSECVEFALRRCGLRHSLTLKPEQLKSVEVVLAGSHVIAVPSPSHSEKRSFPKPGILFRVLFIWRNKSIYAYPGQGHARQTTLRRVHARVITPCARWRLARVVVYHDLRVQSGIVTRDDRRIDVAFSSRCTSSRHSGVVARHPSGWGTSLLEGIFPLNEPIRARLFLLAPRPKSRRHHINKGWAWFEASIYYATIPLHITLVTYPLCRNSWWHLLYLYEEEQPEMRWLIIWRGKKEREKTQETTKIVF